MLKVQMASDAAANSVAPSCPHANTEVTDIIYWSRNDITSGTDAVVMYLNSSREEACFGSMAIASYDAVRDDSEIRLEL